MICFHNPNESHGWLSNWYLPEALRGTIFYNPSEMGYEKRIKDWQDYLKQTWKSN